MTLDTSGYIRLNLHESEDGNIKPGTPPLLFLVIGFSCFWFDDVVTRLHHPGKHYGNPGQVDLMFSTDFVFHDHSTV